MTTRNRSRPRGAASYTARLAQRAAPPRPARHWPTWLTTRHWPALLALIAEAGHLTAALIEWPAAPLRGLFHVVIAATFGVLAANVYFGPTRRALALGAGLVTGAPMIWLAGALFGRSPFQDYPIPAAISLTLMELILAGLLTAHHLAAPPARSTTQAGGPGRKRPHPSKA